MVNEFHSVFDTVYVGGGTPSSIPRDTFSAFMQGLASSLPRIPLEFTVEANPETVDRWFLDSIALAGATRISLGIQTLSDGVLKTVGRLGSRAATISALELIRDHWKGDLSVDLIAGFPDQSEKNLIDDLATVLEYSPGHVSLYSLTVEEGTPLEKAIRNGSIRMPEGGEQDEVWLAGRDYLVSRGYIQYEVSNFALPGKDCRHNRHYWDLDPYIGIGPGGVSTLPGISHLANGFVRQAEGNLGAVRVVNTSNIERFCSDENFGMLFETIQPADFMFEHFMMGLRTRDGLSLDRYRTRFGSEPESYNPATVEKWRAKGMLETTRDRLRMTESGLLFLNEFLVELLPD
jgi:oxygen-independent coproporphyrinogen-3 oxidase